LLSLKEPKKPSLKTYLTAFVFALCRNNDNNL
jgi:hypothetical protein